MGEKFEVVAIFEVEAKDAEEAERKIATRLSRGLSLLPTKAGVLLKVPDK